MNKELAKKLKMMAYQIENFLNKEEILTLSNIVKYYSPLKEHPLVIFLQTLNRLP